MEEALFFFLKGQFENNAVVAEGRREESLFSQEYGFPAGCLSPFVPSDRTPVVNSELLV